ncbi:hypothetical protein RSJ42_07930 [Methanosarcina hadiensis]|uniref:hypothetical protein n=1 Tax=Methanosarcina hadiensis TaxID=3078083 RepID=UPI00397779E2
MAASWSTSRTLGAREKPFSWQIDSRGNIFIKRKFRRALFPRIDKISCSHLEKLHEFMRDMENGKTWQMMRRNCIWGLKRKG